MNYYWNSEMDIAYFLKLIPLSMLNETAFIWSSIKIQLNLLYVS